MAKSTRPKKFTRKKEMDKAAAVVAEIVAEGPPEGATPSQRPPVVCKPGQIPEVEARVLVNRLVHKMPLHEAARAAGITSEAKEENQDKVLSKKATRIINKHKDANSAFLQAMQDEGIDAAFIVGKIKEGMNAVAHLRVKDGLEEVPDFNARHKYIETAIDIQGAKAPKKVEIEQLTFEQRLLRITVGKEGD